MIPYDQLSLADIFSDCQEIYGSDKPAFLSLLQEHIDLDEIVPSSGLPSLSQASQGILRL